MACIANLRCAMGEDTIIIAYKVISGVIALKGNNNSIIVASRGFIVTGQLSC